MFLKRLEITGFKSFPDKIRLDFPAGITAVVGPNGSGKSNIGDAVRWVMGEQSVKSLRGAKMEDVIFSGTAHRKPMGYAEVHMIIDNENGVLSVPFNEVKVTRRVYRAGDSDYRINGASCRLKDIHALFMDTGVGREGYSIIGQGRVDEILSTRSEDRRLLFEEAAGIVKYKVRRNEANSKLEAEKQNLARVNDLIEELAVQIEPLARQAEKAKLYLNLRDQYKSIHINLFLDEAEKAEEQRKKNEAALTDLTNQADSEKQKLEQAQEALQSLKESQELAETAYKQANHQMVNRVSEIEKAESAVKLTQAQQEHIKTDSERIIKEINKQEFTLLEKQTEQKNEETAYIKLQESLATAQTRLEEKQATYAQFSASLREQESMLEQYNTDMMEKTQQAAAQSSSLQQQEMAMAAYEERKGQLQTEEQNINAILSEYEKQHTELAETLRNHEQEAEGLNQRLEGITQRRAQLLEEGEILRKKSMAIQKELHERASRHKLLSEMERGYEGYYASVKTILRKKRDDAAFGQGIFGAAGELINVPQDYEYAISVVLGSAAQNIITATEADAQRAISFLKSVKGGRATFLPISAMKPRHETSEMRQLLAENGVIGLASTLSSYEPTYATVFSHLLGNVFVVDNLPRAIELARKYRHAYRIVTLEGDLISPGGAMTGGSAGKQSTGLLGRGRQIEELAENITNLRNQMQELEVAQQGQAVKEQSALESIAQTQQALQKALLAKNDCENRIANNNTQLQQVKSNFQTLAHEKGQLTQRIDETQQIIQKLKQERLETEADISQIKREQEEYRQRQTDGRGQQDEFMTDLTNSQVEIGQLTQRLATTKEHATRAERECTTIEANKSALNVELEQLAQKNEECQNFLETAQENLVGLKSQLSKQQEELTATEHHREELKEAIGRAETDEREYFETGARLGQAIARLEARREQDEAESRRLYNEVWESYGLTFQSAQSFRDTSQSNSFLRREEKRLKSELSALGDVNVGAVEAYKALYERHDFLTTQRDDILQAEEQLREVIQQLSEQMEQQFTEQFTLINKHFNDVFQAMFGGGRAGLSMNEPDRVLESGIEITAQPPGKNLQSLSLLSGGERALTAIALLFGILRMKPSPFCILDEIEAALDDANVSRFANFLRQYAGDTQFIVVTHRKGTMECADTLYGVTMQEVGISTLVSVDFKHYN